jgi:hypothetical protein
MRSQVYFAVTSSSRSSLIGKQVPFLEVRRGRRPQGPPPGSWEGDG